MYYELVPRIFESGLNAKMVVAACGIKSHSIYSRFRYATGFGIKAFVLHHRLQVAKQLLEHTSVSISQIALAVGYATPSGFSTTFKRHEGCTPSAFRNKKRKKDEKKDDREW